MHLIILYNTVLIYEYYKFMTNKCNGIHNTQYTSIYYITKYKNFIFQFCEDINTEILDSIYNQLYY